MAVEEPKSDDQMAMLMQQVRDIDMQQRRASMRLGGATAGRALYRQSGATFAQLQQLAPLPGGFNPSDLAAYNKPILDAFNELTAAQAAVGASDEEKMKQQVIFHKAVMAEGVKLLNKKRDLATEVEKKKLDAEINRAKEHIDALDSMEGRTGRSGGISEYDKGRAAAYSLNAQAEKEGGSISTAQALGKMSTLRSREAIEAYKTELLRVHPAAHGVNKTGFVNDIITPINQTADALEAEGKLKPGSGAASAPELDPDGNPYLGPGGAQGREAILVHMQQGIDNLSAATGGQLGAELAQVASGSTGGRTNDPMEASDLIVNRGLTSPEDKQRYISDINDQKASFMDHILRPNAPPEHKKMRQALVATEAFQQGKQKLGLVTDEAFFRHLRGAYRNLAREGRKQDQATLAALNSGPKPANRTQASAMNALAASTERTLPPKRPSAIAAAPADPMVVTQTTDDIA
jgi:hypothetical protein